jgi:hypothetical protein
MRLKRKLRESDWKRKPRKIKYVTKLNKNAFVKRPKKQLRRKDKKIMPRKKG